MLNENIIFLNDIKTYSTELLEYVKYNFITDEIIKEITIHLESSLFKTDNIPYYHRGTFRYEDEWAEDGWSISDSTGVSICSRKMSWHISIYPDAVHTVNWLKRHDLLSWEVSEDGLRW